MRFGVYITFAIALCCSNIAYGQPSSDRESWNLTYKSGNKQATCTVDVIRKYSDGSALVQAPDGRLLSLMAEDIVAKEPSDQPMKPLTADQMIDQLKEQFGQEFRFHKTKHYVIAFNTTQIYAEWVGQLYERFYRAFFNDWNKRKFKLEEPQFPLVAVVFRNRSDWLEFAHKDIGQDADKMIGYYFINSNRVIMYDITGVDVQVPANEKVPSKLLIQTIKAQPDGERNVATIVHEAVHQLAYNSGLQVRMADNPRWLSEGLAMYFEAPDLNNAQGWTIGNINYFNLRLFLGYANQRSENSLETLIRDDARYSDINTIAISYGESWALTYFLMKNKPLKFTDYMKEISQLEPLGEMDSKKRVEIFVKHFGDLDKLDREFVSFIKRLR